MTTYIVAFEGNSAGVKKQLEELLKSYGIYCPINNTCWAIQSDKTAVAVRDHLNTVLKGNDRLFVIRSGAEAAWINTYGQENTDWLKKYL